MKFILLSLLGALYLVSATETLEGYKVFRMWPKTEEQNAILKSLEDSEDLDFWSDVNRVGLPVDVMVKPHHQSKFIQEINKIGLKVSVFIDNLEEQINKQKVGSYDRSGMTWTSYYNLEDIYAWLDDLTVQYADKVSIEIGGSTFEGRQIKGVKISFGSGKKTVMLEGGIHAREWISPATMTYIINELLTSTDPDFRKVANSFDWYIFPVVNPDGYAFSHASTTNRLWRKTRTVYFGACRGADPNRNWDFHWGRYGTVKLCPVDIYSGPKPFSEKSTETFSKYIASKASNMVAYLSFHSYAQVLLVPYGNTTAPLDNYAETVAIGKVAIEALAKRYGTEYKVGNIAEIMYRVSGVSIDWVKQEFKTPLVYVYELRDRGQYAFILPPEQIIPNCEEVVDSIVAMFLEADKRNVVSLE